MALYVTLVVTWMATVIFKSSQADQKYKRFCYVESWARYRKGGMAFTPEDIGAGLCTHLSLAFASLDDTATHLSDTEDDPDFFRRFNAIKKGHPNLKTLLSVGGGAFGSHLFSKLVSTNNNINSFAQNSIAYLRDRGFDGLDVDWEYPAQKGSPPGDKQRFTQLIQTLHNAFHNEAKRTGKQPLLLTAALNSLPSMVATSYEPVALSKYLDLINLMTYDLHGHWESPLTANHHAALYPSSKDPQHNIDFLATYWSNMGVPKEKILIGLPFYARTFALSNAAVKGVGATASGPGQGGPIIHDSGSLAYYEVCKLLQHGAESHMISQQKVPYMVDGKTWAGYDDEKSLQEKVKYVIDHNYGGVMIWTLSLDDFTGSCGKKYPLMHAVNNAFNTFLG